MKLLCVFIICVLILMGIFLIRDNRALKNMNKKMDDNARKMWINSELLKDWLAIRQNNLSLVDWLTANDINKVAIYGYGILGKALLQELKDSSIETLCLIDKNYKSINTIVPAVGLNDIPECDAVIVSVINYFDEIESELLDKCQYPIISLEDIVYGVGYKFDE